MKLGVLLPSRGLLFSETLDELLRELRPFDYKIYFAHAKPIPDAFNIPLEQALRDKSITDILIVEDDMMLPRGILKKMVDLDVPATALDYPFKKDGEATTLHDPDGMALYTGLGFILVKRWVYDSMPKPVFRIDLAWDTRIEGTKLTMWPRDVSKIKTYGLHDINFGLTLWTNGIPIVPATTAGQRKLLALGQPGSNDGAHIIQELTQVGIDNTTKTDDPHLKAVWTKRISEVKSVEVLDKIPDDIEIVNGQARLREGGDVVI